MHVFSPRYDEEMVQSEGLDRDFRSRSGQCFGLKGTRARDFGKSGPIMWK